MKRYKMEKYEAISVLLKFQWWGMFLACTIGGVIANESILRIKNPDRPKWQNITSKWFLSVFICTLIHAYYEYKNWNPKFEYAFILVASFLHLPIGTWIKEDLWPMITKIVIGSIQQGGKKDD